MGLVFVLLTGEIDLAAGTASGLTAAVMALHLVSKGNLLGAMGTTVFIAVRGRAGGGGRARRDPADLVGHRLGGAWRCCCW